MFSCSLAVSFYAAAAVVSGYFVFEGLATCFSVFFGTTTAAAFVSLVFVVDALFDEGLEGYFLIGLVVF